MTIEETGVDYFIAGGVIAIGGGEQSLSLLNLNILGRTKAGNFLGTVTETVLSRPNDKNNQLNIGETFTLSTTVDPLVGSTKTTSVELTMMGTGTMSGLSGTQNIIIAADNDGKQYIIFPDGDLPSGLLGDLLNTILVTFDTARVGYDFNQNAPLCFTRGTMIETARGSRAIEILAVGDLVLTKDRGLQPIRWIGSRVLAPEILSRHENLRPIRIKKEALGPDTPSADLVVSPQHRILLRSKIAQRMFGTDEILVAAKQLLMLDGVEICDEFFGNVEYFHMLFDQHEVVFANGTEAESLYTGPQALKTVGKAALEEILTIFPELRNADLAPQAARFLPSGRQGRKLVTRHIQHGKPLVAVD